MPNEIAYPGMLFLIILSIEFYIVAAIFTKILSLCGLPEKKLDAMGFFGSIISAVTSILAIFLGYFLMRNLGLTSVEVSPKGIFLVAIVSTIILGIVVKSLEQIKAPTDKHEDE
ncbi:epimerase [Brevibacillus reuszeri]|uniref:epimerase n=1 Tax=Brevibacillus reuszeri TaxID=54915 RepID=UPI00289941AE|nr:epimerase [Brevibacillus reuszeri]